nr:uncharacterized protein LOC106783330 isoform X2 [Equus caballus]
MLTGAGCVGRCLVQDFHSVNVCRMNGVCWSQGLRESWVSAGAGDWEVPREGRAHPWGWGGRELVPGGEGSAHLPDEGFDLYSEGNGKLRAGGVTGSKWCLSISLAGHQQRTFWSKAWSKASRGGGGRQGQRGRGRVCTCPGASGQVMVMSPPPPLCRGAVHTSALSSGQSHPPARRRRERHREVENFSGTPKTREHCLLSPPRSTRTGAQLRAIRLLWRRWSEFAEVKDLRVCQLTGRGVICGEKMGSSTLSSAAEDHGGLHGGLLKLLLERRRAHLHTNVMNNASTLGRHPARCRLAQRWEPDRHQRTLPCPPEAVVSHSWDERDGKLEALGKRHSMVIVLAAKKEANTEENSQEKKRRMALL